MSRFIKGSDRRGRLLLPDCIDDYVAADSLVRVVDMFVDELDLSELGFGAAAATGRPGYHPATMLKLYVYGYLNQVQSSRRLEREAGRNVECMWLTGKLAPDFKTIADFRRNHGAAIQAACRRFVLVCRNLGRIAGGTVAVDGSRLRAVNARDRNFTPVTIRRRMEQVDASIQRYLGMLDTADRQEGEASELRTARLTTRLDALRRQMRDLEAMEQAVVAAPDRQISLTDPDARAMASAGGGTGLVGYNLQAAVDADTHIVGARSDQSWPRPHVAGQHGGTGPRCHRHRYAHLAGRSRLLLGSGGAGLRKGRRRGDLPQATNLRRQGRGALRQAGLCLPTGH
jgi:transposase